MWAARDCQHPGQTEYRRWLFSTAVSVEWCVQYADCRSGSNLLSFRYVTSCYYTQLIGSIIWPIDLCHLQWFWVTSKVMSQVAGLQRTFVRHFVRFQLTRRVARSLGDSWASCFTSVIPLGVRSGTWHASLSHSTDCFRHSLQLCPRCIASYRFLHSYQVKNY